MRSARLLLNSSRQGLIGRGRHDLLHGRSKTTLSDSHDGPTVAFIALGAMGYQMAKRLAIAPVKTAPVDQPSELHGARLHRGSSMHRGMQETVLRRVLVWNRTRQPAEQHAKEFHTVDMGGDKVGSTVGEASVVFMCLPTSDVTFERVRDMAPHLASDAILVDCCTGNPTTSRKIAAWLRANKPGVRYMDCPISGGPGGASEGTLAAMLGGDADAVEIVKPHISAFAANVVYLGPVGSGHAVKAINNACNVSNLLCLHEGMLALKRMGVDPSAALEVINKSSGRSLMSEDRVPQEVITGDFNYGFKLGLMAKDVSIATELMDEYFPQAQVYRRTLKVHEDAMAAGTVNYDSDYTEIVKHQERQIGAVLRTKTMEELEADFQALLAQNKAMREKLGHFNESGPKPSHA